MSYRTLSLEHEISVGKAWQQTQVAIKALPHCFDVTRSYCGHYPGILLVDGKYLRAEPHERKIPVIYGVDYLTHDIPGYRLCQSENYPSLKRFFASLKLAGYPLIALVCDDNRNLEFLGENQCRGAKRRGNIFVKSNLVDPIGLEPTTSSLPAKRSTR